MYALRSSILALNFFILIAPAAADMGLAEMTVIGEELFRDTTLVSPTSNISIEELQSINLTTVEDAIAFEPSLIVRRRFIGDPNGVIGIRGSNMFQTTRSMIFTDGMPLHYHLQTRFAGSPRWSLVSTGEIQDVEIIYGPFSAEYSGNAMGGVVNITTRTPSERRFHIEGTAFSQDYSVLATDDTFNGGKLFVSYEDRIGNFSIFTSYNRLQNNSQPQTQFFNGGFIPDLTDPDDQAIASSAVSVTSGPIAGVDDRNREIVYYGDSGPEKATTDLLKIKLGYDFGRYQFRGSLAYEQRQREEERSNNYLRDANGDVVYDRYFSIAGDSSGRIYDTTSFGTSVFQNRELERNSLLLGAGLSGFIGKGDWVFDTYYSHFEILDDIEIRSGANPNDPGFIAASNSFRGRLTEFDDTGWQIYDFKIGTDSLAGNEQLRLSLGYHHSFYELEINPVRFNSITSARGSARDSSGGKASTDAVFAQFGYKISDRWDLALGLRYEEWTAKDGFFGIPGDPDFVEVPRRTESGASPKFSLAYMPGDSVSWRYSLARALRFPVVEELFRNESSGIRLVVADATLEPENGIHHNISFEKKYVRGFIKVNLFYETIEDVIFNFTEGVNNSNTTTSLPVDEVRTRGAEFIVNQQQLFGSKFDIRFNVSYTDAEITENRLNPSLVGNEFPRMPEWRSNLILTYPVNNNFKLSSSLRYAGDSFGRLDNSDTVDQVFGAHDSFVFLNAKANWQVNEDTSLSIGIDNIANEEAYVFQPWPSRTLYLEGKLQF